MSYDNTIPDGIRGILESIQKNLLDRFGDNLICLILYGSWAKGSAGKESDIDLLAVFKKLDADARKFLHKIEMDAGIEKSITLLPVSIEDFLREKIPLYTAVKKEGKIIWGRVDLTINLEAPHIKYAEFFERSREFEMQKVKIAEDILSRHSDYGTAELCFVASKHAIQAALAMKGIGYSSKIAVLLPLAKEHFGEEIASAFKKLFDLYTKSEYGIEFLTEKEARLAVEYAKKILEVYNTDAK